MKRGRVGEVARSRFLFNEWNFFLVGTSLFRSNLFDRMNRNLTYGLRIGLISRELMGIYRG